MKRNNLWRSLLVLFVLAWSAVELYPPTPRDLIAEFQSRAVSPDTNLTAIVERARALRAAQPDRTDFTNLKDAVGTNQIARYFPFVTIPAGANPQNAVLNRLQKDAAGQIRLGLDLQGGTEFLVALDLSDPSKFASTFEREYARDQAIEVLRKRVDKFGVAEPVIQPAGEDRVVIQLPGLSEADKESARKQLERVAFLEFRLVHPESDTLIRQGIIEPGYEILTETRRGRDGRETVTPYLVKKKGERGLGGKNVRRSVVEHDPVTNEPKINFELDTDGARRFGELTRENVGRLMAIVLDGVLYSAPRINEPIPSGRVQISGSFDTREAFELANVLENPLEAPIKVEGERGVDPSLGRDSIRSGVKAALIGVIAVSAFMLVYYLICGLVANVALALNIVILLGVMCSFDTTLTLPGIAGIVLTIGMAVDANVLIYERIREEAAHGKSLRGAIDAGYDKAFGTIFDSNLTTLIASTLLIFMGTGPVKGFGVTLTIGVSVSMFTALVVTRLIFDFLLNRNLLRSLPMLHVIRGTQFDFLKLAPYTFALSWLLILLGLGYGLLFRGNNLLGIDLRGNPLQGVEFAGGDRLTLSYDQKAPEAGVDKIREAIAALKVGEPMIQYQKDLSGGPRTLQVTAAFEKGALVEETLVKEFPDMKFKRIALEKVGPSIGKEIQKSAILSALLAMFGILIYVAFRYEFSFAVGAVVAVIHDLLMTTGWFFLAGGQLSGPVVAALLTIIGFSINDTIVIFDRIREDLKLGLRGSFREVMNIALNQTLSRTIITSGTVFLSTLSLYLFGGGAINDFAFTFLVGILTGTYSSIYIACALVLWWHRGERPKLASQVALEETPTAAPARA